MAKWAKNGPYMRPKKKLKFYVCVCVCVFYEVLALKTICHFPFLGALHIQIKRHAIFDQEQNDMLFFFILVPQ